MKQRWPAERKDLMTRRSFLAAGARIGVAGITLGTGSDCPWLLDAAHAAQTSAVAQHAVEIEPPTPTGSSSFITRPDLTPPGVSLRRSASLSASGLASGYVFCAPKSPLAANPGELPYGTHPFPSGATPGLMILDTTGELVWFKPLPGAHDIPFNFRVQTYRGRPTLTWFQGTVQGGHATNGHYCLADNGYQQIAQVRATEYPCDLHEFILTPDGTALHTAYQPGMVDDRGRGLIVGHAQEVDVASNDLLLDWPCFPAVRPELSYEPFQDHDYFHINSIDLWPGPNRNLLISSRNTCAVYLVDRRTKHVVWRLGGKQSDFAMGPSTAFFFQHDARALPDGSGISLFDDASQPCPEPFGSGKVLTLDPRTRTATLKHRYTHTDGQLNTPSQGNCQLLGDGGHLIGWGYLPFFSIYGPSETAGAPLLLDGRFPPGASSYRTFLFEWTGHPPLSELRLVVRKTDDNGELTAWVSWNGATEIRSWQLRAGTSLNPPETVATVKKTGFETAIKFTRTGSSHFDVIALDASGQVLGHSPTVAAG